MDDYNENSVNIFNNLTEDMLANQSNNLNYIIKNYKKYNDFFCNYKLFLKKRKKLHNNIKFQGDIWNIIMQIYECELNGDIIYISNISHLANIPQTTVLRHLDSLTNYELVWRVPHAKDKRMIRVRLSPQFKNKLDQLFNVNDSEDYIIAKSDTESKTSE